MNRDIEVRIERLEDRVDQLERGCHTLIEALLREYQEQHDLQPTEPLERLLDELKSAWAQMP